MICQDGEALLLDKSYIVNKNEIMHDGTTGGIFYCRDCRLMIDCSTCETLYRFDNEVLRNRQQNIPPKHCCQQY